MLGWSTATLVVLVLTVMAGPQGQEWLIPLQAWLTISLVAAS